MPAGAIIGGVISVAGGIFGSRRARREARRRENQARALEYKLNELEENRQEIINPYESVTDLSSMMSNPFANLSVATQAAEMQMEQTDIALANTGGATALAQAALQAKKGVAASIEQQEVANEKQRAAGEQALQAQKVAEAKRLQQAEAQGDLFQFQQQEARDMQQLNRLSNQIGALRGQAAMARADETAAMGGIFSGIGDIAGAVAPMLKKS
mgnify:CR=1 FL=1